MEPIRFQVHLYQSPPPPPPKHIFFSFERNSITWLPYHSNHHHIYTCIIIVHRKEGLLPINDVIRDYVKLAVDCDNYHANSKYCLAQLLHDNMDSPQGKALLASSTMRELW